MARRFNDGNIPSGSFKVILDSGDECVAEDFDIEESSNSAWRSDEVGAPNAGIHTRQPTTVRATLQLPSIYVDIPELFSTLVTDFRGLAKLFVITKINQPRKIEDILKLPVELSEVINPTNYSVS